ncbi:MULTISPECIES: LysE family translocator [Myroides]|uniref:Amino acid permease n=1 Tax=Myroides albus TaxID=2562892 RepID=A0A6I3LRQ6_9FLAO|nr:MULTISPECIES: LysE family transporter [Myroides]MTG98655.1 amino acid permease [Myroides albus]MVX36438.1 LysE family transporter [Myroides sp. LoEW2-1]UVD81249.1 LysE family transporter [Myroides albus]
MEVEGIILLLYGFMAAVLGVSLPGLLNMTAVKISQEYGYNDAFKYICGALSVIFIQTFIAIFFSRLIESSPAITEALHEIGLAIFSVLTIYFFFFAKRKEKRKHQGDIPKRQTPFLQGILLASINVFSIPFYVFLSITLATYDYHIFDQIYTILFSLGVVMGSALMFYMYIYFFKKITREDAFILKNINYIIGSITAIISLITVYKLLR